MQCFSDNIEKNSLSILPHPPSVTICCRALQANPATSGFFVLIRGSSHLRRPHEKAVLTQQAQPDGQSFLSNVCVLLPV